MTMVTMILFMSVYDNDNKNFSYRKRIT